jgi:hypothetical protein
MVAILNVSKSIRATFLYNENKVKAGVAQLLLAGNYPMETEKMQQAHRLNMLLKLAAKRESVKKPSVHISLNFAPGEVLPQAKLKQVADDYMEAIGFGKQPYLVYQHFDAGHPHIHIVSVKVDAKGDRLETHLKGENKPGDIRRRLEQKHGLVPAEGHQKELYQIQPVGATKAVYGKAETRKAIYNILINVIPRYNYTTLGEFNAILKGYNINADPGSRDSRIRKRKGLVYRILRPDGSPVGVPIPATRIYDEAGLEMLEQRFLKNKLARVGVRPRVKTLVDLCFKKFPKATFFDLQDELAKSNIRMVGHDNEAGQIFGLTYVDYRDKIAFNGKKLGTQYAANGITRRCHFPPQAPTPAGPITSQSTTESQPEQPSLFQKLVELNLIDADQLFLGEPSADYSSSSGGGLFEILSRGEVLAHWLPYELRRKKKRRRKRNPNY